MVNFGCFLTKKAKICRNQKTVFYSIFFCWEASKDQILKKIISNGLDFGNFLNFLSILAVFLPKKAKTKKLKNCKFYFIGKHLPTKFQKMLSNSLDFANFLHFLSILAVFWPKIGSKMPKSKNNLFVAFSFVGKRLHTKFQKISSNGLNFGKFLFGCFLVKKLPKKAEIQKKFFVAFFFVGKHLHTKFQKISSNGLDFANFLHFCQFWPFISQKRLKSKIGLCGEFSFTKRHLHTKF